MHFASYVNVSQVENLYFVRYLLLSLFRACLYVHPKRALAPSPSVCFQWVFVLPVCKMC